MKSFRENPDGEENQMATKQVGREVFALRKSFECWRRHLDVGSRVVQIKLGPQAKPGDDSGRTRQHSED